MKVFRCKRCDDFLGDMSKGRIKLSAVLLCGKCHGLIVQAISLSKNPVSNNSIFDFFGNIVNKP